MIPYQAHYCRDNPPSSPSGETRRSIGEEAFGFELFGDWVEDAEIWGPEPLLSWALEASASLWEERRYEESEVFIYKLINFLPEFFRLISQPQTKFDTDEINFEFISLVRVCAPLNAATFATEANLLSAASEFLAQARSNLLDVATNLSLLRNSGAMLEFLYDALSSLYLQIGEEFPPLPEATIRQAARYASTENVLISALLGKIGDGRKWTL